MRPASEKRQGTKSRLVGEQRCSGLWGFAGWVARCGGRKGPIRWFCCRGWMRMSDWTSGERAGGRDLRCECERLGFSDASTAIRGEPASISGGAVLVAFPRDHEVSILIGARAGVERWFGCCPRAKVSMMIMRPPQQGHGRGSTRCWPMSAAAAVSVSVEQGGAASNSRACATLAARLPLANSP